MKLRDILKDKGSEIYSVSKDTSIADAVKMMVNKGVGSVIITEGKCPMGIFTERDLLKTVCQSGLDTSKETVESFSKKYSVTPSELEVEIGSGEMVRL